MRSFFSRLLPSSVSFLAIFFFLLLAPQTASGQEISQLEYIHGVSVAVSGLTPYASLGYERRLFSTGSVRGYARLGFALWKSTFYVPATLIITAFSGSHHPEFTIGVAPSSVGYRFWSRNDSDIYIDIGGGIGYRFAPLNKHWFLSAGWFPVVQLDPTSSTLSSKEVKLHTRVGVSVGYGFPRK